jgi:hypothetical protein
LVSAVRVLGVPISALTLADVTVVVGDVPPADMADLLRHEAIHTDQCVTRAPWWAAPLPRGWRARLGLPRFLRDYAAGFWARGYRNNPLEVEAYGGEG